MGDWLDEFDTFEEDEKRRLEEEAERRARIESMPEPDLDDPYLRGMVHNKLKRALEGIRDAPEGEKHETRISRARLVGGLVANNLLKETEALDHLINAALSNTTKPALAEKDVKDGFQHGLTFPLDLKSELAGREEPCHAVVSGEEGGSEELEIPEWAFVPDFTERIPDTETLITFKGARFLSRGNISLLSAIAGQGKTNVCAAIWASVYNPFSDTLGFKIKSGLKVWYLDTEMSVNDSDRTYIRALKRVQLDSEKKLPENMKWVNLRGGSLNQRRGFLFTLLEYPKSPDIVIIDGIGDFIADVNNPEATAELVSRICGAVHRNGTGVLSTIHLNPSKDGSSEKPRGHLGSEVWRKAEASVALLKRKGEDEDSDYRVITSKHALGKIRGDRDDLELAYIWDDEKKMHVSMNDGDIPKPQHKPSPLQELKSRIYDYLFDGHGGENQSEIMRGLEITNKRLFQSALKELEKSGEIEITEDGLKKCVYLK